MSLHDCLPAHLAGPATTITPIAAGLSGAGVHRVDAAGATFVLKVSADAEPVASWRAQVEILRMAAAAGVAPPVIHVDETRRAVLSAFVVDRSFPRLYGTPATRDAALALLGVTLRRVHELPLPPEMVPADPRALLTTFRDQLGPGFVPGFVAEAIAGALTEEPPPADRAPVLSHNDVNPTNLAFDGERVLLLDWNTAGPNDPLYDLAAIAVFLRMDDEAARAVLAAHDGAPVAALPARFGYWRRHVAVLCGTAFLNVARQRGHTGATGDETVASTESLTDFYDRLRAGAVSIAHADGQWAFGLALVKTSLGG